MVRESFAERENIMVLRRELKLLRDKNWATVNLPGEEVIKIKGRREDERP